jgi:AmmeMemoRadiSam system protein B
MAIFSSRPSPIAGTWYEGRPTRLAEQIDDYLNRADLPDLPGEVVALVAPHAGHRYSGAVAGYAFATVRGRKYDLVAVIAPMHHFYTQPLLTTAHNAYVTPLGEIPVNREIIRELGDDLQEDGLELTPVANDQEHSLEIELPFLQRALGGPFELLPVMVRAQMPAVSQALGRALARVLKERNALLVASTDLSHFYPQEIAERLDAEMLRCIETFSPEAVFEAESSGQGFACGHAAVAAVLWAARELGASQVKILKYATSGDVTGDYTQVVGYGAAVVLRI